MMPLSALEVTDLKAALEAGRADAAGWSHGVYLQMADRATHLVYSNVGHVLRMRGISLNAERRDVTSQLSGGWREKLPTMKDGGKLAFLVHFDKAEATLGSAGLAGAALAQSLEQFRLSLADGSVYQFGAYVGLEFDQGARGRLLGVVTLDISGAVTAV